MKKEKVLDDIDKEILKILQTRFAQTVLRFLKFAPASWLNIYLYFSTNSFGKRVSLLLR